MELKNHPWLNYIVPATSNECDPPSVWRHDFAISDLPKVTVTLISVPTLPSTTCCLLLSQLQRKPHSSTSPLQCIHTHSAKTFKQWILKARTPPLASCRSDLKNDLVTTDHLYVQLLIFNIRKWIIKLLCFWTWSDMQREHKINHARTYTIKR